MRSFDFAPYYRSTVGFDRLFSMLDQVGGVEASAPSFQQSPGGPADQARRLKIRVDAIWERPGCQGAFVCSPSLAATLEVEILS